MILLLTNTLVGQDKTNVEMALSKFLAGDFRESNINFTKAIQTDTLVFENYYLRGVTRLYLNDTLGAIDDFKNAVKLKKRIHSTCKDSLATALFVIRPKDNSNQINHPYALDSNLYKIQLATWLYLKENDVTKPCKMYRQLIKSGIKSAKTLVNQVCVCCG